MECEDLNRIPLIFENDQYVMTPLLNTSAMVMPLSGVSSTSSHSSSSCTHQQAPASENQKKGSPKTKSNKNVPSSSSSGTNPKNVAAGKKKKLTKPFYCVSCKVPLGAGDFRCHTLGKQHMRKAVPEMLNEYSVTVKGFNKDTTEKDLYDYFGTFGRVKTVFIDGDEELCAGIEFLRKCGVYHTTTYCGRHRLGKSNLKVIQGLPLEKPENVLLNECASDSQKMGSVMEKVVKPRNLREYCRVCGIVFSAGSSREHYLSIQHTQRAYFTFRENHCITVKGFRSDIKRRALYDYFSRAGKVATLVIFSEKKVCAVVEYLQWCSRDHVLNYDSPHILENCKLVVSSGMPFGGRLPNMPDYLNQNIGSRKNLSSEQKKKKNVAGSSGKAHKGEMNGTPGKNKGKGLQNTQAVCKVCPATVSAVNRRSHYLGKSHIKKAIPLMKESHCITVSNCPVTFSKEELYDYFSYFENVHTIDTRRIKESLVVIEFESQHPLKGVVDLVNQLVIGNRTVIVIRGCPSLDVAAQSTVSHNARKHLQQEPKTVNIRSESQTKSSASRTLDSLVKNDLKSAMKALSVQESSVKTVTENAGTCNVKHSTPSDEIMSYKRSALNKENEQEPVPKPLMCDICNLFFKPVDIRVHHLSKKHNENAMKYLNENCCISVKGLTKDVKAEHLYDYFSQFGKVKAVAINKSKERGSLVGFYNEESVHSAAKADVFNTNELYVEFGHRSLYGRGKPLENLPPHDDLISSLQECETVECQISCLQSSVLLSGEDLNARIDLCNLIKESLGKFFPNCTLHLFGSSVNSFGLKGSDMDLLFETNHLDESAMVEQEEHDGKRKIKSPSYQDVIGGRVSVEDLAALPKISQLDFIKKVLRKWKGKGLSEFYAVVFVSSASCPVVKFISKRYGLSCDLSNGNRLSLCNTGLLKTFGRLDERVIPLVTVLRYWAKKFNYICTSNFSSYAFTLMVIFFLQTREPRILPSVEYLRSYADKKMEVAGLDCSFCSDTAKIEHSTNVETIESLLFEFFEYYGKFDYSKFVISPLTGLCEVVELFKSSGPSSSQNFKIGEVCIQDPFLVSRNVSGFVKPESLACMTEHMRKISREHYEYFKKQKKLQTNSPIPLWGIPQLFEIMPKNLKVPKKGRGANPYTMVKIILEEKIMNGVKQKYDISCTQCISLTEIAIHEVCCLVIDVLHTLMFDTEITFDERNNREWALKAENSSFSCTCAEACSRTDMSIGKSEENLLEISGSSTDLSTSDEEPTGSGLEINGKSCSLDSTSQDSDVDQLSDEESNEKTIDVDLLDTQGSAASTKAPERFDVSKHKQFLSLWFTATHETWSFRKRYRKQCKNEGSIFEIEKSASQKITQVKSLKLKKAEKFKCEFYDYYYDTKPVLYLKVTPPDLSPCWKPATSFFKVYIPKMVQCSLSS